MNFVKHEGLVAAVCVSVAVVFVSASFLYFSKSRRKPSTNAKPNETKQKVNRELEQSISAEQFTRTRSFLGDSFDTLSTSFVIFVGVGGVGSHAAHMAVRSGVLKVRLIDSELISSSSLQGHSVATRADLGMPKVHVLRDHLLQTCPQADIHTRHVTLDSDNISLLLSGNPKFVVESVSNLEIKALVINYCLKHKIKIITTIPPYNYSNEENLDSWPVPSDATLISIADISHPALSEFKLGLLELGVEKLENVPVLFSTETTYSSEKLRTKHEMKPPFLAPMTAMYGNALASFVLMDLVNKRLEVASPPHYPLKFYKKLLALLIQNEVKYHDDEDNTTEKIQLCDVIWVVDKVWGGVSALSKQKRELVLARWDKNSKPKRDNLILLTVPEFHQHYSYQSFEEMPQSFVKYVNTQLNRVS